MKAFYARYAYIEASNARNQPGADINSPLSEIWAPARTHTHLVLE
jgi:hypothetical protein